MSLTELAIAFPSLAALVFAVLWYYNRGKRIRAEKALEASRKENDRLNAVLLVERKISKIRMERIGKLSESLLGRQKEDHEADEKANPDAVLDGLRGGDASRRGSG